MAMRYKVLGRSGLRVSELALGTMTFGEDWGWGASREESRRIFDAFVAAGGTFVDTANNYTNGTSERFVGEFVRDDRERFVVATKYSLSTRPDDPNAGGNHRKNLVQSVEASLRRLGTGYIDLLWLHMWDFLTPVEEVMRAMDDVIRAGKVLYAAFSDTPGWILSRAVSLAEWHGWPMPVAAQFPYSLVWRDADREVLPAARALGLGMVPWGVIGQGLLTGKYHRQDGEPRRFGAEEVDAQELETAARVLELAREWDIAPVPLAIAWVRRRDPQMIPLVGARTRVQLEDSLAALDVTLSEEQLQRLDEATRIPVGFPMSFLTSRHVQGLIFGETGDMLDRELPGAAGRP